MLVLNFQNLIGFAISALVTLLVSTQLIRAYLKKREKTLGYFAGFLTARFFMFLGFFLTPLSYLISRDLAMAGTLFVYTWIAAFVSFVFPALLFSSFKWNKIKVFYAGVVGLIGAVAAGIMIFDFTPAQYLPQFGVVVASLPKLALNLYAMGKLMGVLPLGIYFLWQIRNADKRVRIRSFLIGLGLVWVVSTLLVPQLIAAMAPLYFIGIYACIGDLLIFLGVKYRVAAV